METKKNRIGSGSTRGKSLERTHHALLLRVGQQRLLDPLQSFGLCALGVMGGRESYESETHTAAIDRPIRIS